MLKVAHTELSETEYQLLARYAEEHRLTVKEALRMAVQKLVLDDKAYSADPIFKNVERLQSWGGRPGGQSTTIRYSTASLDLSRYYHLVCKLHLSFLFFLG